MVQNKYIYTRDRRGRDRMEVEFTTNYIMSAYPILLMSYSATIIEILLKVALNTITLTVTLYNINI